MNPRIFVGIGAILGVVLIASLISGKGGPPGSSSYELKEVVRQQLKDPGSAEFRNERVVKQADGSYWLCGEVNSKNSFGGYAGFHRVVAGPGGALLESPGRDGGVFNGLWLRTCR